MALSDPAAVVLGAAIAGVIGLIGTLTTWGLQRGQRKQERDLANDERQHASDMAREERQHASDMAREERQHATEMAEAQRRHQDISTVYPDIQRWVIEEMMWAERTCPLQGSTQERPNPPTDDDITNLQTQVYAYASEPLKMQMDEFLKRRRLVYLNAMFYSEQEQRAKSHPLQTQLDEDVPNYYLLVESERESMRKANEAIRRLIRDELAPTAALPVSKG